MNQVPTPRRRVPHPEILCNLAAIILLAMLCVFCLSLRAAYADASESHLPSESVYQENSELVRPAGDRTADSVG
ncbi:MAG: hypothetical protein VB055_09200 [Oscillospiraceae bacterium]|nr:hypothetical protein [Oscillospiraceae bacterium]